MFRPDKIYTADKVEYARGELFGTDGGVVESYLRHCSVTWQNVGFEIVAISTDNSARNREFVQKILCSGLMQP
ncbi:hypothetical protein TCAL_15940 [Tigriopus californicus]|uniref:Uncharacterized protein n=1 Tax=Tigriopus californicus TaxID=6832 RepID=A0A553PFG4_TIGCA|nr:hypothetical protein TCAL_15940 [Tigriopus californicus]